LSLENYTGMGKQVSNRHQKNRLLGHARIGFLYKSTRFNRTLLYLYIDFFRQHHAEVLQVMQ
jgi:hypothetical protein